MRTASKQKKSSPKKCEKEEKKRECPQICVNALDNFVTTNVSDRVEEIRQKFLWETGGIQRFRIDVLSRMEMEEYPYSKIFMSGSFFVHYNPINNEIVDKTIESDEKSKFCI